MQHILIVDDDPLMSDLYRTILESAGMEVTVLASGADAVEVAYKLKPSLIALDIMMPGMSGMEVLSKMREMPELSGVPIIMLSNFADQKYEQQALDLGASKYVLKSNYLPASFLEMVQEVIAPKQKKSAKKVV